ncbi:MAG: McrC family protein [Acidimicrobiia bacterium]|nr:McrC family protein [Acidimicrobiia bacterium]
MNHLFERFVTIQLRRHLAGKLEVHDQVKTYLDTAHKVTMYPDLVFYRRGEPILVADVKYKLTEDGFGQNSDYYQLLAYCDAIGLRNGVLLYGATSQDDPVVRIETWSEQRLVILPLNLGGPPTEISQRLHDLALGTLVPLSRTEVEWAPRAIA